MIKNIFRAVILMEDMVDRVIKLELDEIETYAKSLPEKKINLIKPVGPKILGKIDLEDDGKKRFK